MHKHIRVVGQVGAVMVCAVALNLSIARVEAADDGPGNSVTIEIRGEYRYITSNGLPDHETGRFPNRGNPNTIEPQRYSFRVPAHPTTAPTVTRLGQQPFGIAVNGLLFDPGTAEFWRDDPSLGWHMEAIGGPRNLGLDQNNAHVQPNGAYHYHGIPVGLIQKLKNNADAKNPLLLGWAADGFPIYSAEGFTDPTNPKGPAKKLTSSYRLKKGERPSPSAGPGGEFSGSYTEDWEYMNGAGDLDECNGLFANTSEFPQGTYCYVITDQFPFIPRSYRGTPDESFRRRGPGPGRNGMPPPRGGRRGMPPPP